MVGEIIKMPNSEVKEQTPRVIELVEANPKEPEPKILVRCELVGNEVKLTGDENIIENLQEDGVLSREGEQVFPRDGERFLEALRTNFRNPYLYAREVK